ncbi:type II secretion system protein N [Undibacterium fentianense]|uniref:Type II secretion system protein GspC N-terminal domain-containing protein n=1 Tax=Undibacterium fentianense TaxID=2828728 RepID=A0A941DX89_9BURK|nr:type II secretion system protein N [Undibacterium fentianense]MBR7798415.1 hypothetical protein [Undibacterium fentianense]
MIKRLPIILNIILFGLLCAVLSFWGLQIFKPKIRPIQAPVVVDSFEPAVGQWGSMFGLSAVAESAPSSYQLKGVIVAAKPADSVAIIVVDGKPNFAVKIGKELMPGVKLEEVHASYVMVSESGVPRRIDLPVVPQGGGSQNLAPNPEAMTFRAPGVVPPQTMPPSS